MFTPKTEKIERLARIFPKVITELESIFHGPLNIYIDWQNVIHWQEKLGWHFSVRRMKQFFDSFDTIQSVKIYTGTLEGDAKSEKQIEELTALRYIVSTKPVKIMPISIDVSSIPSNSPAILKNFISKNLLSKLDIESIEYLNGKLSSLNKQGILKIEEQKCNFDVEMGRDMLLDFERNSIKTFALWSGDSDFADPIRQIKNDGRRAVVFSISRKVTPELNQTNALIFEIRKIKEFVCWSKEIPQEVRGKINVL